MNGVHDMGGMQDMGPIVREQNEPVFHEPWEGRVYALNKAVRVGSERNVDLFRFAVEQIPPARYLASSYYERWLLGLEKLLLDGAVLSAEELADGQARPGGVPAPVLTAEDVRSSLVPWRAPQPEADVPPRFNVGDRVRARNINPRGHTRLPRYIRGRLGIIERDLGVQTFPDSWVARHDAKYQHVYSVRFAAQELWGPDASSRDGVYLDVWDDYLEAD